MNEKRCATCAWHLHEGEKLECVNYWSDFCCDWTDDDFVCEQWEATET